MPRPYLFALFAGLLVVSAFLAFRQYQLEQQLTALSARLEATEKAATPPPPAPTKATILDAPPLLPDAIDLFETAGSQNPLESLRPRYESTLITFYVLHRCSLASDADLATLQQKITQSLQALLQKNSSAPVESFYTTLKQSAETSYQILYGQVACADIKNLSAMAQKFQVFLHETPSKSLKK